MEDIETIQNIINTYKIFSNVPIEENDIKALENIVKDYKELEEENKILKGNYITLMVDIQLVTSELGFPEDFVTADEMIKRIKEEFIPTSVIQNKILNPMKEEHDKAIKEFMKKEIPECIAGGEVAQTLGYFIGEIEELLKGDKAYE